MTAIDALLSKITTHFADQLQSCVRAYDELTLEIEKKDLRAVCLALRDESDFAFKQLIDVCGVDYLHYGLAEWQTDSSTETGFSRGVKRDKMESTWKKPRFAAVYHLLSLTNNQRLRLKIFVDEADMQVDSVTDIWPSAEWYEREAFDLYGIIFVGNPDLRRILTDYGFIGHPFRKDFPLSGHVEVRYDAKARRVVYEPVDIEPRVLVPKVIRDDNRYDNNKRDAAQRNQGEDNA